MPHGKTLEMRYVSRSKPIEPLPHPTPGRNRKLNGKKRRWMRKNLQRFDRWLARQPEGVEPVIEQEQSS